MTVTDKFFRPHLHYRLRTKPFQAEHLRLKSCYVASTEHRIAVSYCFIVILPVNSVLLSVTIILLPVNTVLLSVIITLLPVDTVLLTGFMI